MSKRADKQAQIILVYIDAFCSDLVGGGLRIESIVEVHSAGARCGYGYVSAGSHSAGSNSVGSHTSVAIITFHVHLVDRVAEACAWSLAKATESARLQREGRERCSIF